MKRIITIGREFGSGGLMKKRINCSGKKMQSPVHKIPKKAAVPSAYLSVWRIRPPFPAPKFVEMIAARPVPHCRHNTARRY